jgi:hypothetical protein
LADSPDPKASPKDPSIVNFNLVFNITFNRLVHFLLETGEPAFSEEINPAHLLQDTDHTSEERHPHSLLIQPVAQDFEEKPPVVAILSAIIP